MEALKERKKQLEQELRKINEEMNEPKRKDLQKYVGRYFKKYGKYVKVTGVRDWNTVITSEINCQDNLCFGTTNFPESISFFEDDGSDFKVQEITKKEYNAEIDKVIEKIKEMKQ